MNKEILPDPFLAHLGALYSGGCLSRSIHFGEIFAQKLLLLLRTFRTDRTHSRYDDERLKTTNKFKKQQYGKFFLDI